MSRRLRLVTSAVVSTLPRKLITLVNAHKTTLADCTSKTNPTTSCTKFLNMRRQMIIYRQLIPIAAWAHVNLTNLACQPPRTSESLSTDKTRKSAIISNARTTKNKQLTTGNRRTRLTDPWRSEIIRQRKQRSSQAPGDSRAREMF